MRIREAVFVALTSFVAFVIIINIAGSCLGLWEIPSRSALEGRDYKTLEQSSSIESVMKGKFQSTFEQYMSDRIPYRDDVMIANASLQRIGIIGASKVFGYQSYHTFYGSSFAYCSAVDAVYSVPTKVGEHDDKTWSLIGDAFTKAVKKSPDVKQWRIGIADASDISLASPLQKLVKNSLDYPTVMERLKAELPKSCKLVDLGSDYAKGDKELYAYDYFRSDHHWQVMGAAKAYTKIVSSLGREPIDLSDVYVTFDDQFFGYNSRAALVDYVWDDVYDIEYPHSNLRIVVDGVEGTYNDIDNMWNEDGSPFKKESKFSSITFHRGNKPLIEYENYSLDENAGSLLLIGDSFTNCNDRFYAESYRHVYALDPRYYEGSLSEFISEHNVEEVVCLTALSTLEKKAVRICIGS